MVNYDGRPGPSSSRPLPHDSRPPNTIPYPLPEDNERRYPLPEPLYDDGRTEYMPNQNGNQSHELRNEQFNRHERSTQHDYMNQSSFPPTNNQQRHDQFPPPADRFYSERNRNREAWDRSQEFGPRNAPPRDIDRDRNVLENRDYSGAGPSNRQYDNPDFRQDGLGPWNGPPRDVERVRNMSENRDYSGAGPSNRQYDNPDFRQDGIGPRNGPPRDVDRGRNMSENRDYSGAGPSNRQYDNPDFRQDGHQQWSQRGHMNGFNDGLNDTSNGNHGRMSGGYGRPPSGRPWSPSKDRNGGEDRYGREDRHGGDMHAPSEMERSGDRAWYDGRRRERPLQRPEMDHRGGEGVGRHMHGHGRNQDRNQNIGMNRTRGRDDADGWSNDPDRDRNPRNRRGDDDRDRYANGDSRMGDEGSDRERENGRPTTGPSLLHRKQWPSSDNEQRPRSSSHPSIHREPPERHPKYGVDPNIRIPKISKRNRSASEHGSDHDADNQDGQNGRNQMNTPMQSSPFPRRHSDQFYGKNSLFGAEENDKRKTKRPRLENRSQRQQQRQVNGEVQRNGELDYFDDEIQPVAGASDRHRGPYNRHAPHNRDHKRRLSVSPQRGPRDKNGPKVANDGHSRRQRHESRGVGYQNKSPRQQQTAARKTAPNHQQARLADNSDDTLDDEIVRKPPRYIPGSDDEDDEPVRPPQRAGPDDNAQQTQPAAAFVNEEAPTEVPDEPPPVINYPELVPSFESVNPITAEKETLIVRSRAKSSRMRSRPRRVLAPSTSENGEQIKKEKRDGTGDDGNDGDDENSDIQICDMFEKELKDLEQQLRGCNVNDGNSGAAEATGGENATEDAAVDSITKELKQLQAKREKLNSKQLSPKKRSKSKPVKKSARKEARMIMLESQMNIDLMKRGRKGSKKTKKNGQSAAAAIFLKDCGNELGDDEVSLRLHTCVCGQLDEPRVEVDGAKGSIQCGLCGQWSHIKCVRLDKDEKKLEAFRKGKKRFMCWDCIDNFPIHEVETETAAIDHVINGIGTGTGTGANDDSGVAISQTWTDKDVSMNPAEVNLTHDDEAQSPAKSRPRSNHKTDQVIAFIDLCDDSPPRRNQTDVGGDDDDEIMAIDVVNRAGVAVGAGNTSEGMAIDIESGDGGAGGNNSNINSRNSSDSINNDCPSSGHPRAIKWSNHMMAVHPLNRAQRTKSASVSGNSGKRVGVRSKLSEQQNKIRSENVDLLWQGIVKDSAGERERRLLDEKFHPW